MENSRPTPVLEDLDATRNKLESWLSGRCAHLVHITQISIPESTGMSNVTLLFDIEWQEAGRQRSESCVGRLQPEIERPVFPNYDLTLQYQVMDSLGSNSDIPVPALLGLEADKALLGIQFYIMRRLEGRIPGDMPPYNMDGWLLNEANEQQRADVWNMAIDTMARFHRLDYRALGFGYLEVPGKTPLQQQLEYWQTYLNWALEGSGHEICQRALDWLTANQPGAEPTVLCWGDARLGNIIFRPSLNGVAALLDWEMAVLGNPVQDLAWFNYLDASFAEGLGMPRLAGLPSYEETINRWQQHSGIAADAYDYYLVFAGMRYGLILSRIMLATGQEQEIQGNFACRLLERYMNEIIR